MSLERTYPCCDCCATDLPHIERDQHTVPCDICHPSPVQRARMAAAWDEGYLAGDAAAFNGHINGHPANPYKPTEEHR